MIYMISADSISPLDDTFISKHLPEDIPPEHIFAFTTNADALTMIGPLIHGPLVRDAKSSKSMFFENHSGFDFITINTPTIKSTNYGDEKIAIFLNDEFLLFYSESEDLLEDIHDLIEVLEYKLSNKRSYYSQSFSLDKILYLFFEKMTILPTDFLDDFEEKTYDLETTLIESIDADYVQDIIMLRKDLFSLKKHYEQLLDILDDLQENENSFLDEDTIKLFKIFAAKVNRHYTNILSLRDYVTQVREAYQSQIDIEQNKIMKIFTVITAIFFPLTLIAGWYGMNLSMPEYHFPLMYPIVIVSSLIILALSLMYFKKKKWF